MIAQRRSRDAAQLQLADIEHEAEQMVRNGDTTLRRHSRAWFYI